MLIIFRSYRLSTRDFWKDLQTSLRVLLASAWLSFWTMMAR